MNNLEHELISLIQEFIEVSKRFLDQDIISQEQYEAMVQNKILFLNESTKKYHANV